MTNEMNVNPEQEQAPNGGQGGSNETPQESTEPKLFSEDYVKDLRAENAKHRTLNKDLATLLESLTGLVSGQAEPDSTTPPTANTEKGQAYATQVQQAIAALNERMESMQGEAIKRELEATKKSIAVEFGLSPTLAARLQGETEEELRADAKTLAEAAGLKPRTGKGESGSSSDVKERMRQKLYGGVSPFKGAGVNPNE